MNRTYRNMAHYTNNHCTESAIEFFPHLIDAQCVHDTTDLQQSDYDSLEEWANAVIDSDGREHLFNDGGDLL